MTLQNSDWQKNQDKKKDIQIVFKKTYTVDWEYAILRGIKSFINLFKKEKK